MFYYNGLNYGITQGNENLSDETKSVIASTNYISNQISTQIENFGKNQISEINYSISEQTYKLLASQEQMKNVFGEKFDKLSNKLSLGFKFLQSKLFDIEDSINEVASEICDKLDSIHDIVNNPRRTQARELYRSAERNANAKLFEEALDDLKKAVELERTDYLSWKLKGSIELFGKSDFGNVVNISEANKSLELAAKYVTADLNINQNIELTRIAADIYQMYAYSELILSGICLQNGDYDGHKAYLKSSKTKYEKVISLCKEGNKGNLSKIMYQYGKINYFLGETNEALQIFEKLWFDSTSKDYGVTAFFDPELIDFQPEMTQVIQKIVSELQKSIESGKQNLKARLDNVYFYTEEKQMNDSIRHFVKRDYEKNYLSCFQELNELKVMNKKFDGLYVDVHKRIASRFESSDLKKEFHDFYITKEQVSTNGRPLFKIERFPAAIIEYDKAWVDYNKQMEYYSGYRVKAKGNNDDTHYCIHKFVLDNGIVYDAFFVLSSDKTIPAEIKEKNGYTLDYYQGYFTKHDIERGKVVELPKNCIPLVDKRGKKFYLGWEDKESNIKFNYEATKYNAIYVRRTCGNKQLIIDNDIDPSQFKMTFFDYIKKLD